MARKIVRPFGILGSPYEVDDRGLLYYRLSWLIAVAWIVAVPFLIRDMMALGIAFLAVLGLIWWLLSLVRSHGHRLLT
jgi:hypothetical protein